MPFLCFFQNSLVTQKGCIGVLYLCIRIQMEVCVNCRYQHIANLPIRKTTKVQVSLDILQNKSL